MWKTLKLWTAAASCVNYGVLAQEVSEENNISNWARYLFFLFLFLNALTAFSLSLVAHQKPSSSHLELPENLRSNAISGISPV